MIFHIAFAQQWAAAQESGSYPWSTRGRTIAEHGFLHGSDSPDQVRRVADAVYADVTEPLVLLHIDEQALGAHGLVLRREPGNPADPDGELFPHVYGGPLPVAVVADVTAFR